MSGYGLLAFSLLGFVLIMHLIFVNALIGAVVLAVIMRFLAYRRGDPSLEYLARNSFMIAVVSDLFGGVWGTVLTVTLAGLFPSMTAIFMRVDFYPVAIALAGILVSIPLIIMYWHLWYRVSPRTHALMGIPLLVSVLLVPIGFRYLFAELDYPMGLNGQVNPVAVFSNPLYPPLILHTLLGATDIGVFMVAAVLSTRRNLNINAVKYALGIGVMLLIPQAIAGAYYYVTLGRYDPYIVSAISGPLLGYKPSTVLFYPAFYAAIALTVALAVVATYAFYLTMQGRVNRALNIGAGVIAELVLVLMEYVNDGSRYPYMFPGIPVDRLLNTLIPIPITGIVVAIASVLVFTAIFSIYIYEAVLRRLLPEEETHLTMQGH
ncbi:cytochrome ubiquinol oxidase subunit I [Vulcanisaeta thermophila]|uniref:cytochrome ubiquinol oxidase subunit I n=1 Tax=Vulcanisaeta thermophila TaxID=867917 RepID=UPI000853CC89|nr:cytochrome ubiquinol oxidase subunit I [Vulcanisaeta thermophila]